MKALWHWANRLIGRHKKPRKVELYSSAATGIHVTAYYCEDCGHSWIKITKES